MALESLEQPGKEIRGLAGIHDAPYPCPCGKRLGFYDLLLTANRLLFECSCGRAYIIKETEDRRALVHLHYYARPVNACRIDFVRRAYYGVFDQQESWQGLEEEDCTAALDLQRKTLEFEGVGSSREFDRLMPPHYRLELVRALQKFCRANSHRPDYGWLLTEMLKLDLPYGFSETLEKIVRHYYYEAFLKAGLHRALEDIEVSPAARGIRDRATKISEMVLLPNYGVHFVSRHGLGYRDIYVLGKFFRNHSTHAFQVLENAYLEDWGLSASDLLDDLPLLSWLLDRDYTAFKLAFYVRRLLDAPHTPWANPRDVLVFVRDYIQMALQLGEEYKKYSLKLKELHDALVEKYYIQQNPVLCRKVSEYLQKHKGIKQAKGDFLAVAPEDVKDLLREGMQLKHCVLLYAPYLDEWNTMIYFVRKKENPAQAFVTIEVKGGKITQARGKLNKPVTGQKVGAYLEELARVNGWQYLP